MVTDNDDITRGRGPATSERFYSFAISDDEDGRPVGEVHKRQKIDKRIPMSREPQIQKELMPNAAADAFRAPQPDREDMFLSQELMRDLTQSPSTLRDTPIDLNSYDPDKGLSDQDLYNLPPALQLPTNPKPKYFPTNLAGMATTATPRRRNRKTFDEDEEEALIKGYKEFKTEANVWVCIKDKYKGIFKDRTPVDLKDKWRNIKRKVQKEGKKLDDTIMETSEENPNEKEGEKEKGTEKEIVKEKPKARRKPAEDE